MRVRRIDLVTTSAMHPELSKPVRLDNGFMRLEGYASRAGVFTYYNADGTERLEFRPPEEVGKANCLQSLEHCPLTDNHPREGYVGPDNVGRYARGVVLEGVGFDPNTNLMSVRVLATHPDLISKLERQEKAELSCGYEADVVPEAGVWQGQPYTHVQRNMIHNHLAVVNQGRAGAQCRLRLDAEGNVLPLDTSGTPPSNGSAPTIPTQPATREEKKDMAKVYMGGIEFEVDDKVAAAIVAERAKSDAERANLEVQLAARAAQTTAATTQAQTAEQQVADAKRAMSAMEGEKQNLAAQVTDARTKLDAATAKIAMLEAQRNDAMDEMKIAERVATRAKLQQEAGRILGAEYKTAGKKDHDIRCDVLEAVARNNKPLQEQIATKRADMASITTMYEAVLPFALNPGESYPASAPGNPAQGTPTSAHSIAKYEQMSREAWKTKSPKA